MKREGLPEDKVKSVLVTGASGFIGSCIVSELRDRYRVIGLYNCNSKNLFELLDDDCVVKGDISDKTFLKHVFKTYCPDIVVHCAGIAHHNKLSSHNEKKYDLINYRAVVDLALAAANSNSDVHFIFLSSVSVYGEKNKGEELKEETPCSPTTPYAKSKLNTEKALKEIFQKRLLKKIDIFRLAPVYDLGWSLNLDKRVFAPRKICYMKFGSGKQRMSLLSNRNLSDFILHRIENIAENQFCTIFNVTDKAPSTFSEIIMVFKNSMQHPKRFTVRVPLIFIWIGTRLAGIVFRNNSNWIYSCYDKVANSLVFSNKKMLDTGFEPVHELKTVFKRK